ncbi:hypothetical protein [Metallosphaera hakonensis]|uniref:Calcium binding protein SSO6904 domain-containing protein n=1 Tax=Metallosphaera hakonensis JCM 8857 = DSM 7519 TaxID=1293036 RepID=A0A2U9IVC5_9CREN|nr:hypothetical protein [Metallosphaera hakonensis]AWR99934.1 hypothetical protein DFR87_09840 [Metallosphaera hakonensis JCM 8857 = DSM 7519]
MSVLDQEEFVKLRSLKTKIDPKEVEQILSELELDTRKTNDPHMSLIFVYANHVEAVRRNKETYSLIRTIIEKYSAKLGIEGVKELILSSLS